MKKSLIILGSLVIVLAVAVSGFSKSPAQRKLAQSNATEKELGAVKAFQRDFSLNFEACQQNTKFIPPAKKGYSSELKCEVTVFPETGEEEGLSNSLDDQDTYILIKQDKWGNDITAHLDTYFSGFTIHTSWGSDTEVTKEEFLAAAQKLIDKFPKVSAKLIRVVH